MTNNFRVQSFSSCHDAAPSCSTTCGKKFIWLTKSPCFWSCMTPISSEKHLVFYHIFSNFLQIFLNFPNSKRKIPKFLIPVTSGNGKFSEISPKLLTMPWIGHGFITREIVSVLVFRLTSPNYRNEPPPARRNRKTEWRGAAGGCAARETSGLLTTE